MKKKNVSEPEWYEQDYVPCPGPPLPVRVRKIKHEVGDLVRHPEFGVCRIREIVGDKILIQEVGEEVITAN